MIGREDASCYQFGRYELDPLNRVLRCDGAPINIEPKVLEFLVHLVRNRHRLVTHDELRKQLWPGIAVAQASLGRLAKEARRLVGDTGDLQHTICTRRGHGYQFVAPTRTVSPIEPAPVVGSFPGQVPVDTAETTVVESSEDSLGLSLHWVVPRDFTIRLQRERPLTIGRVSECDLNLQGPSLSRQHARLVPDGPVWLIDDLGSRNGTFVNGVRCNRTPLTPGDVLRLGDWVGVIEPAHREQSTPFGTIAKGLYGGPILRQALGASWELVDVEHPLHVCGSAGVGKRAVAAALHSRSGRMGPFVEFRCGAAATHSDPQGGATDIDSNDLQHQWDRAARGTLLLHRVPDLAFPEQELLTLLLGQPADGTVRPLCVSTSLAPLAEYVSRGTLSPNLYEVLQGLEIRVPSLQQRAADVPALFTCFLAEQTGGSIPKLTSRLVERLCVYTWPTNVRELRALAREIALTHEQASELDVEALPHWVAHPSASGSLPTQRDSVP